MKNYSFIIALLFISVISLAQDVKMSIVNDTYEITYKCAPFMVADTLLQYADGERKFSYLKFEESDYDYITDEDSPQIPFMSLSLRLPDDAENVYVEVEHVQYDKIELPLLLQPTQMYMQDERPHEFRYHKGRDFLNVREAALCSVSPVYTTIGCKGVTVNIYPFDYYFEQTNTGKDVSNMSYVKSATFRVIYTSGETENKDARYTSLESLQQDVDELSVFAFDNYKYLPVQSTATTSYRYLIITESKYRNSLTPFVNYKDSLGYTMQVVNTTSTGETADSIRNYLVWYYKQHPDLRYVLLVGDIDHIPFSCGSNESTSNPPTDVYYSCLDYYKISNQKDLHPDVYVGRWIVNNIPYSSSVADYKRNTLEHIIKKTIKTEKNLYKVSNSSKHIALFSGSGSGENMFYDCIDDIRGDYLSSYYNYYTKIVDGRDSNNSIMLTNVLNAVNYAWIVFYVGHSNTNIGFGSPYNVDAWSIVNNLSNYSNLFFPFVISNGCKMGNVLGQPLSGFVNSWLCSINGGVGLLASTVDTYYPPSFYYLKKVALLLKKDPHPNIPWGMLCAEGGSNYYHADKVLYRKRMYLKMVCFGDPSLMINGNNMSNPLHAPKIEPIENSMSDLFDFQVDNTPMYIYSMSGNLIEVLTSTEELRNTKLEKGMYILCTQNNGYCESVKYVVY